MNSEFNYGRSINLSQEFVGKENVLRVFEEVFHRNKTGLADLKESIVG